MEIWASAQVPSPRSDLISQNERRGSRPRGAESAAARPDATRIADIACAAPASATRDARGKQGVCAVPAAALAAACGTRCPQEPGSTQRVLLMSGV